MVLCCRINRRSAWKPGRICWAARQSAAQTRVMPPGAAQHRRAGEHADRQKRRGRGSAASPVDGAAKRSQRPRERGSAREKPRQVVRQGGGGRIAAGRLLLEALEANRLEVARDARTQPAWGHRFVEADALQTSRRRSRRKREDGRSASRTGSRPRHTHRSGGRHLPAGLPPAPAPCRRAFRGIPCCEFSCGSFQQLGQAEIGDLGDEFELIVRKGGRAHRRRLSGRA